MPKYLIAVFIVEIEPKFDYLKKLCEPFLYEGERSADFSAIPSDSYLNSLLSRMVEGSTIDEAEEFATASIFNRKIIHRGAMLVHSSALVFDGKAYLFSADSGVGKSTHTKMWLKRFGSKAHILNDDKPVVKIKNEVPLCCGTPFDGGSGIANNETVPVGAIIFIERSDDNFVTIPDTNEIVQRLYKSTVKFVNKSDGMSLLSNLDNLIRHTKFYVLHCNTDECAVDVAYNNIIKNCK